MSEKRYRTDFLFNTTNTLIGMGSVLNIAGNYFQFNYSQTDEEADTKAMESDWGVIGQDIQEVIKTNPAQSLRTSN